MNFIKFDKRASKTTRSSCQLQFHCNGYIENDTATTKINKTIIKQVTHKLKKEGVNLKPSSIHNGAFHMTIRIGGFAYDDFHQQFNDSTSYSLQKLLLPALRQFKVSVIRLQLEEHNCPDEELIYVEFGSNVYHGDSQPVIEVRKATDLATSAKVIAKCHPDQTRAIIDRFALIAADELDAAAMIKEQIIRIRKKLGPDGKLEVYTTCNWSHHWDGDELVIQYPLAERGRETGELRFQVDINEPLQAQQDDQEQEPVSTIHTPTAEQGYTPMHDYQPPTPTFGAYQQPEPEPEEQYNYIDPQKTFATKQAVVPTFQLKYIITQGDYITRFGLAQVTAVGDELKVKNESLQSIGIAKICDAKQAQIAIEIDPEKQVNIGRSNPQFSPLQSFMAEWKTGEIERLAPFGFSGKHLLADTTEQRVALTPVEGCCAHTCYHLTSDAATPVTETTELMHGDKLLLGCFIFELNYQSPLLADHHDTTH